MKQKAFSIIFKRLSNRRKGLRPETGPLSE